MRRLVALACLGLAACGQVASSPTVSGPSAPVPTASQTPGASSSTHELLFVVGLGQPCGLNCASPIGIVGLDGRVHAQAKFVPPAQPAIGCEGSFVTNPVQVAAGSVYYLDSTSALHRLSVTGDNRVVAKFSVLTSQQITWFAVSPDGKKVIASVVAWPPLVSPTTDPSQGCPQHVPGDVREELELATVGGSTTTFWNKTLSGGVKGPPAALLAVAGWDGIGPLATTDTHMAYIGYVEGTIWLGPAAHLDSQGQVGSAIGGPDCNPAFGDLPDGRLVCYDPKHPTVRDADGHILWSLKTLDPNDSFTYGDIALSPDASRVAFNLNSNCCFVFDSSVIRSRDGVRIGLGTTFQPLGWLDTTTVIGQKGIVKSTCSGCPASFVPDDLALIRVTSPTIIVDLGLKGTFLGLVQGS
jgi:hypothetical protein